MHDVEDNPKSVKEICILVFRSPEIRVPDFAGLGPFKLTNQLEQYSLKKHQVRFRLTTNLLLTFSFQIIPFYKSPADILWLAGDDDHNFDSALYARLAAELVRI